jgi:endonuclease-3 related protein
MTGSDLLEMYRLMAGAFGPQHWWPAETPFEVMVGAILVQNTSWSNAALAVANLKERGLLDARRLVALGREDVAALIRPSRFYNMKAERLLVLVRWLLDRYDGGVDGMSRVPTEQLRQELLGLRGVGPETADSILLYAAERPVFVVDAYTLRVLSRHGLVAPGATYADLQRFFEDRLPRDVALYNEYHALLVALGKDICRPKPRCGDCPLRDFFEARRLPARLGRKRGPAAG